MTSLQWLLIAYAVVLVASWAYMCFLRRSRAAQQAA